MEDIDLRKNTEHVEQPNTVSVKYRFDIIQDKLYRQEIPSDPKFNIMETEAGPDEFEVAVKQWEEQAQRVKQLLAERTTQPTFK